MGTAASNSRCSDCNDFTNQRLALSFRRWDYPAILRVAVSPIQKYRSEPSLYFYSLWYNIPNTVILADWLRYKLFLD